jgi:peptide subunit release factor 1 (eRF1)
LDKEYSEENRGAVIYADLEGDWFDALQFPVPIGNRLVVDDRPMVAPIAQVLESYHHHGVVLLDRERVRILSVYLDTLVDEIEVHREPSPGKHDIQSGGYSHSRFQRRKLEETRHFFKEFAQEVENFDQHYRPQDLIILGTDEIVAQFKEFLSADLQDKIVLTGPMAVGEPTSDILARIEPLLRAERHRESEERLQVLRDRVRQDYLATAGFQSTLAALQEGKVETLVIAQDQKREGARCPKCGFVFSGEVDKCPYDGSRVQAGVDVVEEVIRLAEQQGAEIEFVASGDVGDLAGVGAILRF